MKRSRHPENALPFVLALAALLLAGCSGDTPAGPGLTPASETLDASAAAQGGFVILEPPETPGWPLYIGFVPLPEFSTDEGETLIFFFRERSCIPPDFNQLLPFAPADDCPLLYDTKEWWLPEDLEIAGGPWGAPFGDPNFRVPVQATFKGDAIPVWAVSLTDLLAAFVGDGVLTIGELEALERVEGTATHFNNVVENSNRATSTPSMRPNHSVVVASGSLEDGRSFRAHFQERRGEFNHIDLVIK